MVLFHPVPGPSPADKRGVTVDQSSTLTTGNKSRIALRCLLEEASTSGYVPATKASYSR